MTGLWIATAFAWQIVAPVQTRVSAPQPFEAIGIKWTAGSTLPVRVRVSPDAKQWTGWTTLALDTDLTDPSEGRYLSAITHFGSTNRFVDYAFDGTARDVTIVFFAPPERRVHATASGGVRLRADWGCPDGEGSRWTPQYTTVTHAVVHHTAGANDLVDWEAEVRNIWYYHTVTNGWGDIGYNFLIDPNGVVYEGRAGGHGAIGAHFSCMNSNTVGIALLGTFTSVSPAPAALDSLRRLLAAICDEDHIDPLAAALLPRTGLVLPTIIGHRDGNLSPNTCNKGTECPGDVLYSMLPSIRSDVATAIEQPKVRRRAVRH